MKTTRWIPPWIVLVVLLIGATAVFVPAAIAQNIYLLMVIDNGNPKIGIQHERDKANIETLIKNSLTLMLENEKPSSKVAITELLSNDRQATRENILGWLDNVKPNTDSVVFVYFSGGGGTDKDGTKEHYLLIQRNEKLYRKEVVTAMAALNCRLKILITEADSVGPPITKPMDLTTTNQPTDDSTSATITVTNALRHLFLQHEGFLNLTAATEGERSFGHNNEGGWFTTSLVDTIFEPPDLNGDAFVSWEEIFKGTRRLTVERFEISMNASPRLKDYLTRIGQTTQRPNYYGELPKRIEP